MSSVAVPAPLNRVFRFYQTTVGKKAVMAITGLILFGFVVFHLIGNLQAFFGREMFDRYAAFLKEVPELLYPARIILLTCVLLHIIVTIQLATAKSAARPTAYVKKDNSHSTYASRTMYWSGPIIAAFVIYHLLHFTFLSIDPTFVEGHVFDNVVKGFSHWPVSLAYIVSVSLLGIHLSHGIYGMTQSLGLTSASYAPRILAFSRAFALLLTLGFISIPVAVLAGVIHL